MFLFDSHISSEKLEGQVSIIHLIDKETETRVKITEDIIILKIIHFLKI